MTTNDNATSAHLHHVKLQSNDLGAISLVALFFLILLLGGLAAILGLNFEIRLREGLQDGSDAVAFSAALIVARGMNLLVLFNQIMMLLVAILVALRLAQTLLIIASIVAAALAWVTFGASLAIAASLATTANQFGNAYRSAKPIVFNGLRALEAAQSLTRNITPAAAVGDSLFERKNHTWVDGALAIPAAWQLPVEKDEFSVLCGKSSQWVLSLALGPLTSFSSDVSDKAKSGSEEIGKKTSGFLCGKPGSSVDPPTHEEKLEVRLPSSRAAQLCEENPDSSGCRDALREAEAESPQASTGECPRTSSCTLDSPYIQRASAARRECKNQGSKVTSYQYQMHQVEAEFLFTRVGWVETERKLSAPRLLESTQPPCGGGKLLGNDWNEAGERPDGRTPVCDEFQDFWLNEIATPGETRTRRYQQVTRILSCVVEITKTIPLAEREDALADLSAERGPLSLENEYELGGTSSQVRALVWALQASPIQPKNYADSYAGSQQKKSRFAFSQAEFFFDHEGDLARSEWMWERRWKSRLRQVRFPEGQGSTPLQPPATADQGGDCKGDCTEGLKLMTELQGLILH